MSVTGTMGNKKLKIGELDIEILSKLSGAYAEGMSVFELSKLLNVGQFRVSARLAKLKAHGLIQGDKEFRLTDIGSQYLYSKYRRTDLSDAKSDPK